MSAPAPALASPAPLRAARLRLIPPIETYPPIVAFAQVPAGKAAIVGAFALGYGCFLPRPAEWLLVALSIGLITFLPNLRWEGFEPPIRFSRIPVFKTGAFNDSSPQNYYSFTTVGGFSRRDLILLRTEGLA